MLETLIGLIQQNVNIFPFVDWDPRTNVGGALGGDLKDLALLKFARVDAGVELAVDVDVLFPEVGVMVELVYVRSVIDHSRTWREGRTDSVSLCSFQEKQ